MDTTLRFLGAAGTVTGSKTLLDARGMRVLIDCGLFQGWKQLRLRNREPLPPEAASPAAVVLTHAHLDHSGWLPLLARSGYDGPVWCTSGTRDLCRILLPDSGRLLEEEAEYANRHGFSKHHPALPLYTEEDAKRSLKLLRAVEYDRPVPLTRGLTLRLRPAGHLLGSSIAVFDIDGRRLAFSGDLGRPQDLLMRPPAQLDEVDWLVIESTYGNREHDPVSPLDRLADVVNRTAARGGKLLIPTFAVGRAQTLMLCLARLQAAGRIPDLPTFLDSPMAIDATQIYAAHAGEHRLDAEQCKVMCGAARPVNTASESAALDTRRGSMIVLAASGMATGGRVVHHLKAWAPDPRNTVLFSGYQAGGTRGASMLRGDATVRIHGQDVPVRAEIDALDNLSAHADATELIDWLRALRRPPRAVFVNHGEPDAADALRARIERTLGWTVHVPEHGQRFTLD